MGARFSGMRGAQRKGGECTDEMDMQQFVSVHEHARIAEPCDRENAEQDSSGTLDRGNAITPAGKRNDAQGDHHRKRAGEQLQLLRGLQRSDFRELDERRKKRPMSVLELKCGVRKRQLEVRRVKVELIECRIAKPEIHGAASVLSSRSRSEKIAAAAT